MNYFILNTKTLRIRVISVVLAIFSCSTAFSGEKSSLIHALNSQEQPVASDKIYYGGNVGLSFGSYTMIAVRPLVGYKVSPKLSVGLKISYEYISDNRYSTNYTTSNYGGSIFARYRFIPQLYAHVEYAYMNYELYNILGESQREWVPFLFVGAGYSQNLGGNTWLNIQILFDVLQSDKSPYNNWEPFYSVGVGVGF